jgi:hypothetical protein
VKATVSARAEQACATWYDQMSKNDYVYDYYLFTTRRGEYPLPWLWEIRRKSKPVDRIVSAESYRSAKAAEEAGMIVLAEVRKEVSKYRENHPPPERLPMTPDRRSEIARNAVEARWRKRLTWVRRREIADAKANQTPLTPERRTEIGRKGAFARAEALSPARRSEIGRMGGLASKGKPKKNRPPTDSF